MPFSQSRMVEWALRVGIFGTFLGHGVLALVGKQSWLGWIQDMIGVDAKTAALLLTLIGIMDCLVAVVILFLRRVPRFVLAWAVIWGFWTALLRPLVGESIWDFVERSANWAAPLALLFHFGWPKKVSDWWK